MPTNDLDTEVNKQIGMAGGLFYRLTSRLWRKHGICMGTKVKIFHAVVTSTLLHMPLGCGCEEEEHANRLETSQYQVAHYNYAWCETHHVRMTTSYDTLRMLSLSVIFIKWTMAWAA